MLEGLMQAYLGSFARGWQPRDEARWHHRDSPRWQTTLSSPESNQGETRNAETMDGRKRRGFGANRLREC